MKLLNKFKLLFLLGIITFGSCVSKKQLLYIQDLNSIDISEVVSSNYYLQENDVLKIDVYTREMKASIPYNKNNEINSVNSIELLSLNGYLVTKNKTINFPVLGEISVLDKTTKDLENHLKQRLVTEGYLLNPNVTVRLVNAKVTILGEVNRPGTYTFTQKNMSLLQILGLAGDLTIDGNRQDVVVIREIDGKRLSTNLDLTSARFLTSTYQNIQPNDVIIVNPNSKRVKSAGLIGNISNAFSIASLLLSTLLLIR